MSGRTALVASRFSLVVILVAAIAALPALAPTPTRAAPAPGAEDEVAPQDETLLLQNPTVSLEHVVFVYARDLWIAPRDGGDARRLTSNPGTETSPRLSPDGRWVAFTGQYEGNTDVYVISVDGGTPRRLTWHPGTDLVADWHPDGRRVIFTSGRDASTSIMRAFAVSIDGGMPAGLDLPRVAHFSFNADASRIAYTPVRDAFRSWKRYRGGRVARVWVYDPTTHDVDEVPHVGANDTFPVWLDGAVYFASDRDGTMNLYKWTPGAKDVVKLTSDAEFDIRNLDAGGGLIVFERGGALHLYDPKRDATKRLRIRVRNDGLHALPRWQAVRGAVRSASISPNGKRAVFEARGEIVTVPREHGDARNLTESPAAHDRSPVWSPDGKQIAWLSDATGEYKLHVADRRAREDAKVYDLGEGGFFHDPHWSPDGKHILFNDKTNRLAFLTLETGKVTDVARMKGSLGVIRPAADWSPDSEWIAFEHRNPATLYDSIALFELATGEVTQVTDAFGSADGPAFSGDGKHLFFQATVDSGPRRFGLDMSTSAARPGDGNLYVTVLRKKLPNPLAPKSDEAFDEEAEAKKAAAKKRAEAKKKAEEEAKKKAEEEEKKKEEEEDGDDDDGDDEDDDEKEPSDDPDEEPTDDDADEEKPAEEKADEPDAAKKPKAKSIDVDGIDQRILALPLGSSRYRGLETAGTKLLFVDSPQGGASALKAFDFDSRKANVIAPNVSGFEVSADGKWMLLRERNGWFTATVTGKSKKPLRIDNVRVRVDPEQEWPQILREVWRIERDYFYDENMHHVDWDAMWERYRPFLPHVRHRSDLNVLIAEMIGELACGHEYVRGGETPSAPSGVSVGLLGADWTTVDDRFQVAKIYRGQNWNPGMRAPLTEPGVDAREGDFLIAVDGRPVTTDDNLFEAFEGTSGRQVEILLAAKADGSEARKMTVVPIGSEGGLRRASWVEANRKRVDELSGGRLAYIYMPNTGGAGLAAFDRDFYSQLDKDGLILDERFNGGGKVADYVIDVLGNEVMCYWMNRERWVGKTPFATMEGPKVMIINERAGSGGDAMPWLFRNMGIGKLVGTRTWGGLVGISGYPPLIDGGSVTAASFGVMDTEGKWAVENVGVAPDYPVVQWPKEVIAGRDPQLEKAVAVAMEQLEKQEKKALPTYHPPSKR